FPISLPSFFTRLDQLLQARLMLALSALRFGLVVEHTARLRLAHLGPRIQLNRFRHRKFGNFSFRHGTPEYGILLSGTEQQNPEFLAGSSIRPSWELTDYGRTRFFHRNQRAAN